MLVLLRHVKLPVFNLAAGHGSASTRALCARAYNALAAPSRLGTRSPAARARPHQPFKLEAV
jgi:hypothetical protein